MKLFATIIFAIGFAVSLGFAQPRGYGAEICVTCDGPCNNDLNCYPGCHCAHSRCRW